LTDDGIIEQYTVNVIAENIYAQCDDDKGHSMVILDEISDHKKDESAIPIINGYIISANGNQIPKKTAQGWLFLLCT
jgi:hypothetical protein